MVRGWDIDRGNMEVGEIIAFVNYITQILFSLMMIGNILLFVSRASASAERVNEVLDTDIDIKNADNPDFTPLSSGEVAFGKCVFRV